MNEQQLLIEFSGIVQKNGESSNIKSLCYYQNTTHASRNGVCNITDIMIDRPHQHRERLRADLGFAKLLVEIFKFLLYRILSAKHLDHLLPRDNLLGKSVQGTKGSLPFGELRTALFENGFADIG